MKKKYGKKAQISGAAAAAWDGAWILAHAIKNGEVDLGQRRSITAMANAFYSGPRGDLAFKGKHYVSLAMFITSYNGSKRNASSASSPRIVPIPANAACQ